MSKPEKGRQKPQLSEKGKVTKAEKRAALIQESVTENRRALERLSKT